MPKLLCPCGYVHDLSPIPDAGWITVRDSEYVSLIEAEIAAVTRESWAREQGEPERTVVGLAGLLYQCPECGRLMWKKSGEGDYRVFSPEEV